MSNLDGVVVVTVTYGKRYEIISEVINGLLVEQNIMEIVVVDNNSEYNLRNLYEKQPKVNVITLQENTGSANGFKVGIEYARKVSNFKYIWLLDDDNKPLEDALAVLVDTYKNLEKRENKDLFALLSLRDDRKEFILSSKYNNSEKFFPKKNSYLGLHYKDLFNKVINRIKKKTLDYSTEKLEIVDVPLAPYGGMFFHKKIIDKIGLPNEEFYLYSDDYEFSYRITKNGGSIYLVPESRIEDIDKSWFVKDNNGFIFSLFKSDSDFRIFYSVRNRIYFEMENLVDNVVTYKINKLIFMLLINTLSLVYNKKERKSLILKAIRLGEAKKLGKVENIRIVN
ncbi:glycosyltransferase [Niallia taxi]|uniref:glycosyltransferase n=1 Tax=Niallia taxi TaxID=2499688 RepID=UPI003981F36A